MANAKQGDTVKVHYLGKLADGSVFDTSEGAEPISVSIGSGQVLKAFEDTLVGMKPGDKKTINIPFEEAYGPRQDDLVIKVERSQIPDDIKLEVGLLLQVGSEEGERAFLTIMDIQDDTVTLDANHPLAGKNLTFDIVLDSIE